MLEVAAQIGAVFGVLPDVALDCDSVTFAIRVAALEPAVDLLAKLNGLS